MRVLDPACGSGNFLYVALKQLLDLEKEVVTYAARSGVGAFFPRVEPGQLYGIEKDPYAHELAQVSVWIGYIQWLRDNGFGVPSDPILKPLENIRQMDAILAFDEADIVIGNPPFLGGSLISGDMSRDYYRSLTTLYRDRVPGFSDLVCYWFERARALIRSGRVKRAGLLATNSIRGGVNRRVLERIKQSGDIFWAWSDRPWSLEGAAVRVSMVGFDDGSETQRFLDSKVVLTINPDLTASTDLTQARRLGENRFICQIRTKKGGAFDLTETQARTFLQCGGNPNGRPNSDVVKPWATEQAVLGRPNKTWIIYFGANTPLNEASLYEAPFEHIRQHVYPVRAENNRGSRRERWWLHSEAAPAMRRALEGLRRFVATPALAKHRIFVWLTHPTLPDQQLLVFAREDDYFFGALHSKFHELWSLRLGTSLEDRPRYTPTTTFETYPFPWPPGTEPQGDPLVEAIAVAARELVEKRDRWLNPEGASESDLRKRTLTNLYNERPTWLALAHERLDRAVLDAYGWPHDLSDEALLERLLALNLERASAGKDAGPQNAGSGDDRLAQPLPA